MLIKMLNALGSSVRAQPSLLSTFPKQITAIRSMQQAPGGNQPEKSSMDQKSSTKKTADTMSSFGEGYATRSDEEGFGGIYGGNQDEDAKTTIHDGSQGSVVKEKETSRNQKNM